MIVDDLARLRTDRSAATALEIGAVIHVVRPLLADLLATLCFYATYAATGSVALSTIAAAVLGVAQFIRVMATRRRVPPLQWASLLLVFLLGGISLATGDARYILYKAAIIYLAIGVTMLRRGWLLRYVPPIAQRYLPAGLIVGFGHMWAGLLLGTGVLSLALIRTTTPRTVALVMGLWAPGSKIVLLIGQYLAGRSVIRRAVIASIRAADAAGTAGR